MSRSRSVAPLVLGAGGMLGAALVRCFERRFPATVSATRAEADVTDRFRLEAEIERLQPSVVINCAAYTDVDGCEVEPARARRVNVDGAENAALAAAASGCRIVHLSTDFVFDGRARRPYVEADATGPLSEYGRSKLEGEARVAAAAPDHLIVRLAWTYGPGRSNFVDTIRRRARQETALKVVDDQFGSPSYVTDVAEALARLIEIDFSGLVHFANTGVCSRYALAKAILEFMLPPGVARLVPITTEEAGRLAVRPAYSALDTTLYARLVGAAPRPWDEALRDYLSTGERPGRGA
ncbi:MAG TPA: dTDP-4-dehydrorhamnose reductase [Candidatus Polarisedimenticolia bacterium]|nr:dTDP-4-dehydrorhamnose reductase [Candidatus Polarisedimenticolia bacterium]